MTPKCQRSLTRMDQTLRQARKETDWYAALPAQAAQAVLKTYFQGLGRLREHARVTLLRCCGGAGWMRALSPG